MQCENVKRTLVDCGWDKSERQRVKAALDHLESCAECQAAVATFEPVASALKPAAGEDPQPLEGWAAFEARLLATAAPKRRRLWPRLFMVAAGLLVGTALGWVLRAGPQPGPGDRVEPLVTNAGFSPSEVAERTAAFSKVSEVFEGKTAWVLMSKLDSDLGVSSASPAAGRRLLLLRLTMTRDRNVVSQADLAILPGQSAEPVVAFVDGQQLRYQIEAPQEGGGNLAVRVQVQNPLEKGRSVAALSTTLVARDDRVIPVGPLVTPKGRYDLNVGVSWSTL